MKSKLFRAIVAIASTSVLSSSFAIASDNYPNKPVKLIVGFPPGGPTDIVGRLIGQGLSKELGGAAVIIENRGGASGTIGAQAVARARPDGYTLLLSVESAQTRPQVLFQKVPYDPVKDFTFIRKVAKQRNILVTHPSFPPNNVKELIAYLKAHPGEVNTGGTFGATSHIGGTLFDMLNNTKMTFISYPGGAAPINDLLAGTLQVGFFTESTIAQYVNNGKLKALAVTAAERSPEFPNLPTIEEAGGKPMDISPWFGVVAPAGTPPEITTKLGKALDKLTASAEFRGQLKTMGAVPIQGSTSESFAKEVGEEIKYWNKWAAETKPPLVN